MHGHLRVEVCTPCARPLRVRVAWLLRAAARSAAAAWAWPPPAECVCYMYKQCGVAARLTSDPPPPKSQSSTSQLTLCSSATQAAQALRSAWSCSRSPYSQPNRAEAAARAAAALSNSTAASFRSQRRQTATASSVSAGCFPVCHGAAASCRCVRCTKARSKWIYLQARRAEHVPPQACRHAGGRSCTMRRYSGMLVVDSSDGRPRRRQMNVLCNPTRLN